jgi:hypothetical protein
MRSPHIGRSRFPLPAMTLPSSSLSWRTALAALAYGCSEALALLRCRLRPRAR